jgi:hypothetical protein
MLCCLKCDHFPLQIKAEEKIEDVEDEPDLQFILHMLNRLDYEAIKSAGKDVCQLLISMLLSKHNPLSADCLLFLFLFFRAAAGYPWTSRPITAQYRIE